MDIRRVLEGGLWSFSNHLLISNRMKKEENPGLVELYQVAKQLGNFVGTFISYELNESLY